MSSYPKRQFLSIRSRRMSEDTQDSPTDSEEEYGSPKSCPIPVPKGSEDRNAMKLSGGSFVPPHLYKKNQDFSEFDYENKKKISQRAF